MLKGKLYSIIGGVVATAYVASSVVGVVQLEHALATQQQNVRELQASVKTTNTEYKKVSSQLESTQTQLSTAKEQLKQANKKILVLNQALAKAKAQRSTIQTSLSSRSEGLLPGVKVYDVVATAYGSSTFDGGAGSGVTAMGTAPVAGRTIAVDPSLIPLGSRVELYCSSQPSINGTYVAEDTGGAIQGYRIDIYMNSRSSMVNFGVRNVTLYVLPKH